MEVGAAYERYQRSATSPRAFRPVLSLPQATCTPELEDLDRLWKKGLISEDEYRAKRARRSSKRCEGKAGSDKKYEWHE